MVDEPLYPHQEEGVQWLMARRQAFLADGMRVGKTRQVIEAARRLKLQRILVICPSGVRINWGRQFERHWRGANSPDVLLNVGSLRTKTNTETNTTIVSYDLLSKNGCYPVLVSFRWDLVVLDEAHYAKEPTAKRTIAAYRLAKGARCWRLSGTPAPNHYGEYYTHVKTAGLWTGTYDDWLSAFCRTWESPYGRRIVGNKNPDQLRALLKPFLLRRTLEEIVSTLPPLIYETVYVEPTPVSVVARAGDVQRAAGEAHTLRAIVTPDMPAGMLTSLQPMAQATRRVTGLQKVAPIAELIDEELASGQYTKLVLFAWHTDVILTLRLCLSKWNPVVIDGQVSPTERERRMERFRTDPSCHLVIGQIVAAGVGIDLSVAHEVVFAECSWVPGENAQAAMRVHHLKQTEPVRVRMMAAAGTIDDAVTEVLRRKTKELTAVLDSTINPFQ